MQHYSGATGLEGRPGCNYQTPAAGGFGRGVMGAGPGGPPYSGAVGGMVSQHPADQGLQVPNAGNAVDLREGVLGGGGAGGGRFLEVPCCTRGGFLEVPCCTRGGFSGGAVL